MYEPRRPTLAATGLLSAWVALLSLPMLAGKFLANQYSDQFATGYAFRAWGAAQWRATGHVPQWNPEIFGGLPFVAAQHGDIFYPTAFLRLLLPTVTAMNLGFAAHYVAAGVMVYLLLRLLGTSWSAAVTGGLAYQLSGVVASLVQPGHDGKLFVSALLPLCLIGLVLALRRGRWEGYAILALGVGLSLFAHYQMIYYGLIVAGLFALYLTYGEPEGTAPVGNRHAALGLALAAVMVGFAVSMIQVLPFYHYIPYSPRAESYYGWEGSTSYAIPWSHVPEFFLANFVGSRETYWGLNSLKLHSEYLGLPVIALAALGAGAVARRRLVLWISGIGLLFLLVSLGAATPFYSLWWSVMPFVKQTRAPGMAFFVVALVVAMLAAFGVQRLEKGEGRAHAVAWLGLGLLVTALGSGGAFNGIAQSFAQAHQAEVAQIGRDLIGAARAGESAQRLGGALSGIALSAIGALVLWFGRKKIPLAALGLGLAFIVSADLWRNATGFWTFTDEHRRLYGSDPILEYIKKTKDDSSRVVNIPRDPARVLNLNVYPGSSLMAYDVPELLGHHGNELRYFDDLLGGKNQWRNLDLNRASANLWDLYAIRFVVFPDQRGAPDSIPGFRKALVGVETAGGERATLFERIVPPAYARVVQAAVKVSDEQAVATVADVRFAVDRAVVLAQDAPMTPKAFTTLPEAIESSARVAPWAPGRMTVTLTPATAVESYLVVSENFYPGWRATVNGAPAPVGRGDASLITVALPPGAKEIQLEFTSTDYQTGRLITFFALGVVLAGLVLPTVLRRSRRA
ncbi:MAG: hypothetical protein EXR93_10595 [Gemmatimonadetes bacterium]|nr:hypothetical protein [Gemmatimonadota bacterium]